MKSQKYETLLIKALQNFCEAADKLATVAVNNDLQESDVKYAQSLTSKRVVELKRQLEHKAVKVDIELPSSSKKGETTVGFQSSNSSL
jgi:hypothetical protein